jgi:hypothetical protein
MPTLHQQLRAWQRREWLYRVAWGAARWTTVALVAVAAACFTDWLIDRYRDTPFALRLLMTALELGVFAGAAYYFLLRLRVPSLVALAGRAEEEVPEFDHRLVTALQLNRPGAQTAGMSAQLIQQVTREAEALSARHRLAALADPRRLKWAASVAAPVLLVALAFAAIQPRLTAALLARQCLLPVDIPRSVRVVNQTPPLWPSGDEVELRLAVTGRVRENTTGVVRVYPEDQPAEEFTLTPAGRAEDGATIFTAKLPPSSAPFTFRARVSDGRLREPGAVRFEPRPVVNDVSAWVLLPPWVDPAGKNRYERFQPQAEVVALADSSVRVAVKLSKPVASAALVVYSRNPNGQEREAQRVPMTLSEDRASAEGLITKLPARPSSYRVQVVDENGFANSNPPRRGIHLAPDEPPHVNLLSETLKGPSDQGAADDYEVNGMPLTLGGQVQVGYIARSPLGLSRARIMYRVNEGPWTPLPLKQVDADSEQVGRFIPELGLFERSAFNSQVEFYPIPATDPAAEPPGLEAGGRYNFQTAALTKMGSGDASAKLEVGDRVEFYVEVFDRNPAENRPPGRSESRIKTVVTQSQLQAWLDQRDQSRQRLKDIEERQRGVFRPKTEQ